MLRQADHARLLQRFSLVLLLAEGCHRADNVCNRHDYEVISVGEVARLRLGTVDFVGDCRDNPSVDPGVAWETKAAAAMSWQGLGPSILLQPDGTLRGLAPGSFSALARRGKATFETEGVVLPEGWKMKLEPENATIRVGDTQPFRVVVADRTGRPLPGVRFSILPAIQPMILRGPGLVTSTDKVPFKAVHAGTTSMSGFVGGHMVTTTLVVRGREDDSDVHPP